MYSDTGMRRKENARLDCIAVMLKANTISAGT